jgi:spore coat polysaccharide biosynthesis protein SpsF (cytidylyltransferase family)
VLCIIQARYSSKRLRGKVLKKIYGLSVLERVYNLVKKSKKISKIIIATSKQASDKKIIKFCKIKKISYFAGPLNNVFKRFYLILKSGNYKSFVRISSDSPFMDPKLIDRGINLFNQNNYDLVTNVFKRTFPKGFSVEVINARIFMDTLSRIKKNEFKEHVTTFFYKNFKNYKIKNFYNRIDKSNINLSIDTKNDFDKAKKIIKFCKNKNFSLNYILKVYTKII